MGTENSLDLAAALPLGSSDETAVAAACAPVAVALAVLIDCCAAPLARVADAVAMLSCEATRRDSTTFDMPASSDGLSAKDEADVTANIKVLVFGSKLVGVAGGAPAAAATFAKVPALSHDLLVSGVDGVDEINEEEESAMAAPVDADYGCDDFRCSTAEQSSQVDCRGSRSGQASSNRVGCHQPANNRN